VRFGDGQVILTTDPITGAAGQIGRLAVHVSCNDIAACGIRPSALMLTLIAPPAAEPADIAAVIDQAAQAAKELSVSIVGGHTEISDAVSRFVAVTCALGFTYGGQIIQASGCQAGDYLVMSKTAGLEGTAILAHDQAARITELFSDAEIAAAQRLADLISVVEEGSCGGKCGAHAMHDATEGGILGAAWEMAAASGLGLTVEVDRIPIHPLTRRICSHFSLDPLRLISSGSMLIATHDPDVLIGELASKGILGSVIGRFTAGSELLLRAGGTESPLVPPESDELYKII
jgi:hydrogenase maturation factor